MCEIYACMHEKRFERITLGRVAFAAFFFRIYILHDDDDDDLNEDK